MARLGGLVQSEGVAHVAGVNYVRWYTVANQTVPCCLLLPQDPRAVQARVLEQRRKEARRAALVRASRNASKGKNKGKRKGDTSGDVRGGGVWG